MLLPYTIEFTTRGGQGRYEGLARILGLPHEDGKSAGLSLAEAIRKLLQELGQPLTLREAGVSPETLEARLDGLCDRAEMDPSLATSRRIPDRGELESLYRCAFEGCPVDF